jgi:hypothetical protein
LRRQWTLQEVIQASDPVVQCGAAQLPWIDFVLALRFLADPLVGETLKEPLSAFRQSLISAASHIHPIFQRILTPKELHPANRVQGVSASFSIPAYSNMLIFRRRILRDSILRGDKRWAEGEAGESTYQQPFVLLCVLELSGKLMAKDPHDKIYGMYTILERFVSDLPPVDYDMDVGRLYEEVTRCIIRSTRSVVVVMYASYTARRADTLLPSWVPDYGAVDAANAIPKRIPLKELTMSSSDARLITRRTASIKRNGGVIHRVAVKTLSPARIP